MNDEPSVIYINNIGSDKSMIFMFNVFVGFVRCYIVLVLLMALKKDLLDRVRRAGVNTIN